MKRIKYLLILLPIIAICGETQRPNVLLIGLETLRADHVGCYGHDRPTTPTLDAFAKEAVKFDLAFSAGGWTMPSMMSVFTGVYPHKHGAINYQNQLADGVTTLAAELKKGGYHTLGVTSNPTTHGKFGFRRGFDFYDDFSVFLANELNLFADNEKPVHAHQSLTSDIVNRLGLRFLKKKWKKEKPFFLHLFYFDPHYDHIPPRDYAQMFTDPDYRGKTDGRNITSLKGRQIPDADKQHVRDLYDAEIRYTDDHLKALFAEMKKMGVYDNTIIIILGDHGDEFWEHGSVAHGHTLYDELLHVPLLVRLPKGLRDTSSNELVHQIDIMPTVLDLLDMPIPAECQGRSLKPILEHKDADIPDQVTFHELHLSNKIVAARSTTQKIIFYPDKQRWECYNLKADRLEQRNLHTGEMPTAFADLYKQFQAWLKKRELTTPKVRKEVELDPKLKKALKALGYMQ